MLILVTTEIISLPPFYFEARATFGDLHIKHVVTDHYRNHEV